MNDVPGTDAGADWGGWRRVARIALQTDHYGQSAAARGRPITAGNLRRLLLRRVGRMDIKLADRPKETIVSDKANPLTYDVLKEAVENAAAFRCRRKLQPAGGEGDKVFPPTYAGAVYAVEQRRVSGRSDPVTCVVLDSVQSQANRMEEALQDAIDEGRIAMPLVIVDFSDEKLLEPVGRISSLQAPHRIADAILRDSEHEKKPFRESAVGHELDCASAIYATPLLKLCPPALVFGMWDSTGPRGGLGPKFERAIVSEIVGVNVASADKNHGIRRDPLGIRAAVKVQKETPAKWKIAADPRAKGAVAPSAINHSSVPFDNDNGGVTLDYAEQTTTLSLIQLRRLRFPLNAKSTATAETNTAARAVLAAMGLVAAALAFGPGVDLRSRCLLFPDSPMIWELLATPGETPRQFSLDATAAIKLFQDAVAAATKAKLPWDVDPIVLTPSKHLVELVRKSQELAVAESTEE